MTQLFKHLNQIYEHREMLYFLALKDVKVRYKMSSLGFLWAIVLPFGQMLILSFVFSKVIRFDIAAYPVFLMVGLLPWTYFSMVTHGTIGSIIENSNLIKKVYFPRDLLPIASGLSILFDYSISLVVLFPMLWFFDVGFSLKLLWLPFVLVLQTVMALGTSLVLSGLNVLYRDVRYIKDLLLMIGFYASPIIYPMTFVEQNLSGVMKKLYYLNPMVGLIDVYRQIFYSHGTPDLMLVCYTTVSSLLLLMFGLFVYSRIERQFADLV